MNAGDGKPGPRHVAVIGGGRWARVITGVLAGLLPDDCALSIHATHSLEATRAWAEAGQWPRKPSVVRGFPDPAEGVFVVVANAARAHADAVEWAIDHRLPVLCEKPLTLSGARTQALIERARVLNSAFYAGHVLLFSGAVERLARLAKTAGSLRSVSMEWSDPHGEVRHGDVKRFDAGLPIFIDVLPHVVSVLWTFMPVGEMSVESVEVLRGGALVKIAARAGRVPVAISMERNGAQRRRGVVIETDNGPLSLDFSAEPGILRRGDAIVPADAGPEQPSPLNRMLVAFLATLRADFPDERLSAGLGLIANTLADAVGERYEAALMARTEQRRQSGTMDPDLRYRLEEILQNEGPLPADVLEQRIFETMNGSNVAGRSGKLFGGTA